MADQLVSVLARAWRHAPRPSGLDACEERVGVIRGRAKQGTRVQYGPTRTVEAWRFRRVRSSRNTFEVYWLS